MIWLSRYGPPSVRMHRWPRPASAPTAARISTLSRPATMTSAPAAAAAARRAGGAASVVITMVRACAGDAASSGLAGSRSSLRLTTAIGGDGARPSRSQAQRTPSVRGRTGR